MDIGPIPVKDLVLATVKGSTDETRGPRKVHVVYPVNYAGEDGLVHAFWDDYNCEHEHFRCLCGQEISENGFGEEFYAEFTWAQYDLFARYPAGRPRELCRKCRAIFEKEYRGVGRVEDVIGEGA
jgi:hypothetical protein